MLGRALQEAGLQMVTAESCTGGLIAKLITDVAGSSEWFERAFITYSNEAKQEMLGVDPTIINEHGAVSEAVVLQMARGALVASKAQLAVSVSGVAGPGGGSVAKPVGTVWFGWAFDAQNVVAEKQLFAGDRESIRAQAAAHAMWRILEYLEST